MNLRIPGPTPCPPEVLEAMTKQMINHRGAEFSTIINECSQTLRSFFRTENDVLTLSTSGTGGLEAAVVNIHSPGDKVLGVCTGVFGDRFSKIAEIYGADVTRLDFAWGSAADPEEIRKALAADPTIKSVLVTHNETSTAVTNDLSAIAKVVKEFDKLLLVDAISSMGAVDLRTDDWGLDVVVAGSQKSWMIPPGLAMVSMSKRAWEAQTQSKMPKFYFDLAAAKKSLDKGQTPYTPAVSLFYALQAALRLMQEEGLDNIIARHARVAQKTREGVKALGLSLFPDERVASNAVTAINTPEGVDAKALLKALREERRIVLSSGQQNLEGKIFRIGHLGLVNEADIDDVIDGLATTLPKFGFPVAEASRI